MAYQRKTYDEWQIHTDYGWGFELECLCDDAKDARATLREYRENMPQYPHKIVKKRIRIER